jgi:hypothetical protein
MRLLIPAFSANTSTNFRLVPSLSLSAQQQEEGMTDSLDDMLEYYGAQQLGPLADELIAAKAGIDMALERWEKANRALAGGWTAIEAKRAAAYQQAAE